MHPFIPTVSLRFTRLNTLMGDTKPLPFQSGTGEAKDTDSQRTVRAVVGADALGNSILTHAGRAGSADMCRIHASDRLATDEVKTPSIRDGEGIAVLTVASTKPALTTFAVRGLCAFGMPGYVLRHLMASEKLLVHALDKLFIKASHSQ
jgi:hypothetical protein